MLTGAKVLIVDDDDRLCRVLSRYLTREGYSVREAANGDEMRARLAEELADLILLDLILPDEDGLSLARDLRAESDVAIIMLTGKTDTIDKIVGLELGADDYITKPFDERELLARMRTVLRRTAKASDSEHSSEDSVAQFAASRMRPRLPMTVLRRLFKSWPSRPAKSTKVAFPGSSAGKLSVAVSLGDARSFICLYAE